MLPTIPVTEPTHWVPATQPSLTSGLPLSRLQSQPDRFTGRNYRANFLVTQSSAAPTIPVLTAGSPVTDFPGYRESLPVTDRSAAPTIPVLTAGSPVTEFTGYRENFLITQICCSHHPSADSRLPSYREICCSHHSSADSRLTGYRVYRLQREFTG